MIVRAKSDQGLEESTQDLNLAHHLTQIGSQSKREGKERVKDQDPLHLRQSLLIEEKVPGIP